jgi:hypothetical protein
MKLTVWRSERLGLESIFSKVKCFPVIAVLLSPREVDIGRDETYRNQKSQTCEPYTVS